MALSERKTRIREIIDVYKIMHNHRARKQMINMRLEIRKAISGSSLSEIF